MKTLKTTFNKILVAALSFLIALTCVFAIPTYKASADTQTENTGFSETIAAFLEAVFADLVLVENGDPLCLLVDYQFFTRETPGFTITSTTTLSDINNSGFIQALARVFAEKIENIVPYSTEPIDPQQIFDQINMNLIIHVGSTNYRNVTTNEYYTRVSNYSSLESCIGDLSDTTIYGLIVFEPITQFYNFLVNVQARHTGTMYAHALDRDGVGNSGGLNATVYGYRGNL